MKISKFSMTLLIVFNIIVLTGQLWPAGAPPFARWVNIGFLIANLLFLVAYLRQASVKDA